MFGRKHLQITIASLVTLMDYCIDTLFFPYLIANFPILHNSIVNMNVKLLFFQVGLDSFVHVFFLGVMSRVWEKTHPGLHLAFVMPSVWKVALHLQLGQGSSMALIRRHHFSSVRACCLLGGCVAFTLV